MTNNAKTVESDTIESLYKTNFLTEINFAIKHLSNAYEWLSKMDMSSQECYEYACKTLRDARDNTSCVQTVVRLELSKEVKE